MPPKIERSEFPEKEEFARKPFAISCSNLGKVDLRFSFEQVGKADNLAEGSSRRRFCRRRLSVQKHDLKNLLPWNELLIGVERKVSIEDQEFCVGDVQGIASSTHCWLRFG